MLRKIFLAFTRDLTTRNTDSERSAGKVAGRKDGRRQNFTMFPPNAVRGPRFSSRLAPGVKITSTRVYLSGNGGAPGVVLARL